MFIFVNMTVLYELVSAHMPTLPIKVPLDMHVDHVRSSVTLKMV